MSWLETWKHIVRAIKHAPRRVDFKWVMGHSKNRHNRAVDKLEDPPMASLTLPSLFSRCGES